MFESARVQSALRQLVVVALPVLATLARFRNGFVFDDVFVIQRGEFIHQLANLPRAFLAHAMVASSQDQAVGKPALDTYRPISIGSFFWDAALSGKQPWSYHLTNLVLHGAVCVLVLRLLDTLVADVSARLRLWLACMFGLSPWLCEAHVFINGRSDLLLALFFVAALLGFRRALLEQRLAPALGAALCMLFALLSKEVAVVLLPFVAAVPCARDLRTRLRLGWPLAISLAVYLALRMSALSGLRSHGDTAQLLLALRNLPLLLVDGLWHTLAPTPFVLRSLRDDYASLGLGHVLGCAVLLAGCMGMLLMRRAWTSIWAWLLAMAGLAPAAMISTMLWPGFGRYLYVPAIGVAVGLGVLLDALAEKTRPALRRLALLTGALLGLASAWLLLDATLTFGDERALYQTARALHPDQAWTHGFLGLTLRREGQCAAAIPLLNEAAKLDPDDARYAIQLGRCLVDIASFEAARGVAERGRTRFRGTRAEPGFLVVQVLASPTASWQAQARAMERCLALDPGRADCQQLLQDITKHAQGAAP